jgi:hypothetical protein
MAFGLIGTVPSWIGVIYKNLSVPQLTEVCHILWRLKIHHFFT